MKDLTRAKRDGDRTSWGELYSPSWFCLFWVLNFEAMKMDPIMRFKKQKRIVGVNQVAMEAHIEITMASK